MILKRFSTVYILLFLLFLFSCKKETTPSPDFDQLKIQIDQVVDRGNLLNSWEKFADEFILYFEKDTLHLSETSLSDIIDHPEKWKTTLIFKDHSELEIPSAGTDLEFIIQDWTLNPSGYNPLSAKIDIHLPARGRIKVIVHGKNGTSGTVEHLFKEQTPRQHLPVLGLYEDHENEIDIVFTDYEGKERGRASMMIPTEKLELTDFPTFQVMVARQDRMESGVNLISYPGQSEIATSTPYMIDADGEIRWILLFKDHPRLSHFAQSVGLKRTQRGTFISGDVSENRIIEIDVLGNLLKEWDLESLGYSFHHEITETSTGHFLITVTKNNATLTNGKPRINDFIIEMDAGTGTVIHEWDLTQMLDSSRYEKPDDNTPAEFVQSPSNWAHNNSITVHQNNLLATLRYQGMFCFSPQGNVQWILSPHRGWSDNFRSALLQPIDRNGDPITDPNVINGTASHPDFEWIWGPHTPVSLPNGNILVFDNGYDRNFISNSRSPDDNYSRAVEYKIDSKTKTVQQVWTYGKERGRETFAQALSGVQHLPATGHILFCPGMGTLTGNGFGGHVIEIDPDTNEVIFELRITSSSYTAFHRATRMSLYPPEL